MGQENLRTRLDPIRKSRLLAFCKAKRISQQDAIEGMLDFLFSQGDELLQSMIVGQITPTRELMELALKTAAKSREKGPKIDVALIDADRNVVGEEPVRSRGSGRIPARTRKS